MTADNVMSIEPDEAGLPRSYSDAAALYREHVHALLASGQALIHGYQSIGAELLAFAQWRAREGLELGRELSQCASPEAAAEVQVAYVSGAAKAYVDEINKLGGLAGGVANAALAPLQARPPEPGTAAGDQRGGLSTDGVPVCVAA